jgi:hypothetical protein
MRNREKRIAKSKAYYLNNRDRVLKRAKQYAIDNKEKINEYQKKYTAEHLAKINSRWAEWKINNSNRFNEKRIQWINENHDLMSSYFATRRARKRGVGYEFIDIRDVYVRDNGICRICGEAVDVALVYPEKNSKSLDHIKPLSKGGSHTWGNVQLAHLICNLRKGIKYEDKCQSETKEKGEEKNRQKEVS